MYKKKDFPRLPNNVMRMIPLRLLLADDNDQFLNLISFFLRSQQDVEVVCLARTGSEALEGVERYHPHAVIIDLNMPYEGEHKVPQTIKERFPSTRVYLCSAHPEETIQESARQLHVDGYISKATLKEGLLETVSKERTFLSTTRDS
jgi:DNA-binding NarL/FixJ family response regulator